MAVKHVDEIPMTQVGVGQKVFKQVLIGPDVGPHFAMRRFIIEPGGYMPTHTNEVEHEQYVLSGRARISIGGEEFEVGPGDVVFIPAKVPHRYRTIGDVPFVFICVVPNLEDKVVILEPEG